MLTDSRFPFTRRLLLSILLLVVLTLVSGAVEAGPPAQISGNLLANPGFESPYAKQCCQPVPQYPAGTPIDEVQVAAGWFGWWRQPSFPDFPPSCEDEAGCDSFHRPEWREAAPYQNRIRSGANAQKYFTFWSNHEAGMYQVVGGITPGQRLFFTAHMHAWSTSNNELTSSGQHTMNLRVGIDPTGGTDAFSPNVVWSPAGNAYDVFAPFSVEAVARSGQVTVFTYSRPIWPLQHNDVYVDDASLVVLGASQPQPTSAPTATPPPIVAPPQPAPIPSSPTSVYVVKPGDYLIRIAAQYGLTLAQLMALNNLTSTVIYPGQVLNVGIAAAPAPPSTPSGTTVEYVVRPGDYLIRIAAIYGVRWQDIMVLNGLTSTVIHPGQALRIPAP